MMWEKKSLGVIADVYNGNSINADYKKKHFLGLADGLPFVATKDVLSNGEIDYNNGVRVPQDAGLKIAPADSVFVCAEGGSAGKKIAYVKEDVCFGNKLFCILPKRKEMYSAKYIYYFCRSELFREQFFGELTGLIGGVSAKKFRNIECPIPPLPEQERIVSLLDLEFAKIDAIKANAEKQLQDAKDLFQSALKDYLTPKEGWKYERLGIIADVYNGNSINADYKKKHFLGLAEGLPFIATKDVLSNGEIDYENGVKVPHDAGLKIAPANSVFVCAEGGSAGKKIAYVKEDVCFGNKLFCILPKKKELYSAKYIYYYCKSDLFRAQFFGELTGLIGGVSAKKFRAIEIPIPPSLSEQQQIAEQLDKISAKIQSLQSNFDTTITLCNDLKQSILKDIFG